MEKKKDPYHVARAGRLAFKGGELASLSKTISKKSKKSKKPKIPVPDDADSFAPSETGVEGAGDGEQAENPEDLSETGVKGAGKGEEIYTIDAAKKMKYRELFPVEARKFGYEAEGAKKFKSIEEALDDRVKKKADRYCK